MRFLYVGAFRFPKGDAAAARVLNNVRVLMELGHNVRVISFGGEKNDNWQEYDGIPYLVTSDIDTHSWRERVDRYTNPYPRCRAILKNLVFDTDAIICYNLSFSFSKWLIPFCKHHRIKLIVDTTEWYSAQEMPGGQWSPIYWMNEYYMKFTLKTVPNRILISRYLANHYPLGNNLILPPLVDVNEVKWNKHVLDYPEVVLKHKGIKILYSGTPDNKDLLGRLVQAALLVLADSPSIQVIVAGVDEEQALSFFEKGSDYYENKSHFVFLGRIPQDTIPAYYHLADFSAIIREPTRKNMAGFPTKMAESMAAGCPVITSKFSDILCYVEDGNNGIVLNGYSVRSIADGLHRILTLSAEQIDTMKIAAKQCGRARFDFRNYIDSVNAFINKVSQANNE